MPRPPRCRRICGAPQVDKFCPNGGEDVEPILLTLDEYEVIRLVDLEQKTHEQCAAQMDISRSTVQEIYESARRKIASCLVHGKPLHITILDLPKDAWRIVNDTLNFPDWQWEEFKKNMRNG